MKDAIDRALAAARAVVFDFDGTLVDSNEIKWSAFESVFAEHSDRLAEIGAYCRGSNHTIRGEKFRYVTERILGLEYTAELEQSLHTRYARYTTAAVANAPEIPGATGFIRQTGNDRAALLSSTPHDILLEILSLRGWRSMFGRIQGAPVSKREWLIDLQESLHCAGSEIVFFGDTEEDQTAGRESGCTFFRIGAGGIRDFTGILSKP